MKQQLLIKLGVVAAVIIASVYFVVPPSKTIRLGLDLQGGLHLVLDVQVEKAVERALERSAEILRKDLQDKGLSVVNVEPSGGQAIRMTFSKPPERNILEETARSSVGLSDIRQQSAEVWLGNIPATELQHIRASVVEQALEKIRNRIDAFGVSEPSISREGTQHIVVQLPGLQDTQRAIDLIGKTAQLEFKLVQSQATTSQLPPGTQILYQARKDPTTKQLVKGQAYVVEKRARLTGDMLEDARALPDQGNFGQYHVSMKLNSRGKRIFAKLTAENVGRALAIVLDDTIFSAPVIQGPISEGEAQITGTFTPEAARDLAIVLREGALPAPVTIIENRTVGPSLGSDSITQGIRSALLGAGLIVLFMLVYYRGSGLIANTALALNLLILMGLLAVPGLGATLTLPGISGIILTLGMAVDSNVLIFERIREELRLGKSVQAAVSAGFERALSAILDSNVTTVISAVVLFQFGSGPVKGFAVTLTIGLLASMFTAIFVSRALYETLFSLRRVTTLSIGTLEFVPRGINIDFLSKAKGFILASIVVIGIGLASVLWHGGFREGIDFGGGLLLQLRFSQAAALGVVREALAPLGLERAIVQHYGNAEQVLIRMAQLPGETQDIAKQVQGTLQESMTPQQVEVQRAEIVGPQASSNLRRQALFAMFYAILGIVIYLSGRFEGKWFVAAALGVVLFAVIYPIAQTFPGISPTMLIVVALVVTTGFGLFLQLYYALAAVIAVYHDVLVAVGFLSLFNKEFDLQIVAALLTIVGYSLNDTIVIFDRVRENMRGQRMEDFPRIINESLNQTLSRTILTTGLTLLVVIALFFLGGEVIHDFAFALLVGMIAGTYSTLFIASPILIYCQQHLAQWRPSWLPAVGGVR